MLDNYWQGYLKPSKKGKPSFWVEPLGSIYNFRKNDKPCLLYWSPYQNPERLCTHCGWKRDEHD